ncbi:MAG: hydantoinase B/oxoprolinase family protein, partial [Sphingomonadaceae bacterium]
SLPSKVSGIPLKAGDTVTIETSGGGGFGDPARRDPKRLAKDLADGLVTPQAASRFYGTEQAKEEAA